VKKEALTLYKMEHSASFLLMKDPMTDKIANLYSRPSFPQHNKAFYSRLHLWIRTIGKTPLRKYKEKSAF
jgi:hypothetical protein